MHWDVVPGSAYPNAGDALEEMLRGATVLRLAVAFVAGAGVTGLASTLERIGRPSTVQATVRATHTVATVEDLRALETELGAEVRAFVGVEARRFHPKVFMTRTPTANWVLSGSGNL